MSEPKVSVKMVLNSYRAEVLRWNRQINLISRKDPEFHADRLLKQSRGGVAAVIDYLKIQEMGVDGSYGDFFYYDLGSGGGFPGVVWHTVLSRKVHNLKTYLVEPREKRAWFLDRLNSVAGMAGFGVLKGRWGEEIVSAGGTHQEPRKRTDAVEDGFVLISLKALFLPDDVVLSGLEKVAPGIFAENSEQKYRIIIARYYPPGQGATKALKDELNIGSVGSGFRVGSRECMPKFFDIIALGQGKGNHSSLVLSEYVVG